LTAALLMATRPVHAQTPPRQPVSQILPNLFGNTIVLTPTGTPEFPNHSAHFKPGAEQLQTPTRFNEQIVTLLATLPVGSSSGGFTYTFNPTLGSFSRSSESFGPLYMERALTIGKDRGSLGVGYQRSTYDTFERKALRQPEIKFYIEHTDCCGATAGGLAVADGTRLNPAFEGDIIEAALTLNLATDTMVFSGAYGITDRFDLGVAVPLVRVDASAAVRARLERLATAANPDVHQFEGDNPDERTFGSSGTATGIGDIVIRAKYNLFRAGGGGLAAALDVRTPTGDESNLLGTGGLQGRLFGIASMTVGKWSPHVNAGYTASTRGGLPGVTLKDEWSYAGGVDVAVSSRLTLLADLLGRTILDAGRFEEADRVFEFLATGTGSTGGGGGGGGGGGSGGGGTTTRTPTRVTRRELQFRPGNLNLLLANVGARFNPVRSLLVSANLLFPLTSAGLRDRVTPAISVDYSF
jgi:hypothetical protein